VTSRINVDTGNVGGGSFLNLPNEEIRKTHFISSPKCEHSNPFRTKLLPRKETPQKVNFVFHDCRSSGPQNKIRSNQHVIFHIILKKILYVPTIIGQRTKW
jgi:hypothetical protein